MENASKALLIAGGVLIAIIVISIAVYIWSIGTGAYSSIEAKKIAKMKEETMIKFSQYVGEVYGAEIENCIRRVAEYNEVNGTNIAVKVTEKRKGKTTTNSYSSLVSGTSGGVINSSTGATNILISATKRNDKYAGTLVTNSNGIIESINFELKTAK